MEKRSNLVSIFNPGIVLVFFSENINIIYIYIYIYIYTHLIVLEMGFILFINF